MPMGVLNNDDFDNEVNSFVPPTAQVEKIEKGRGNTNAVPESLRKVIAEEAIEGTPAKEIQKAFDISASSISAYKNGATSTASYDIPDPSLKKHNNRIRDIITGKARIKLNKALDHITDDKLKDANLAILASVAKSMSAIVKEMEPEEEDNRDKRDRPQFIVFAPQVREATAFEVIDVKE